MYIHLLHVRMFFSFTSTSHSPPHKPMRFAAAVAACVAVVVPLLRCCSCSLLVFLLDISHMSNFDSDAGSDVVFAAACVLCVCMFVRFSFCALFWTERSNCLRRPRRVGWQREGAWLVAMCINNLRLYVQIEYCTRVCECVCKCAVWREEEGGGRDGGSGGNCVICCWLPSTKFMPQTWNACNTHYGFFLLFRFNLAKFAN